MKAAPNFTAAYGALLEVGTGFHPELTGRENVFLNGALVGMRKSEIKRKFDSIVEFAGVAEWIDTPIKAILERHEGKAGICRRSPSRAGNHGD